MQLTAIVMTCVAAVAYPPFMYYQNEGSYSSLNVQLFKIFSAITFPNIDISVYIEICLVLVNFLGLLVFTFIRMYVQRHNSLTWYIVLIHIFHAIYIFEFVLYDVPIVNDILTNIAYTLRNEDHTNEIGKLIGYILLLAAFIFFMCQYVRQLPTYNI